MASKYITHLDGEVKLAASTINQYLFFMRLVWRCLDGKIRGRGDPWQGIRKKRLSRQETRRRSITPEQFDALLQSANSSDMHDLLFVLGWTGQRLVDIVMLRWDTIDFKVNVITLYPRKTKRSNKAVHIPLFPDPKKLLTARRHNVGGQHVFPELIGDYERDRAQLVRRIGAIFEKAGMITSEHRPGVKRAVSRYGAHSLRHFFATQALQAGISGDLIKRITGHGSDDMLENYEHVDAALIGGLAKRIASGKKNPARADPIALPAPTAAKEEPIRPPYELLKRWHGWLKEGKGDRVEADLEKIIGVTERFSAKRVKKPVQRKGAAIKKPSRSG